MKKQRNEKQKAESRKQKWAVVFLLSAFCLLLFTCARPEPLTQAKAEAIIKAWSFKKEPVYAEVPRRVWWSPTSPRDEFDEKSLRTFENLQRVGLITVAERQKGVITERIATATDKGFPILGTAPSFRGQVYRGKIADKVYDGIRNFERHPTEETTGHAELVWHYDNPTPLYDVFETKNNKPLRKPFASHVSFYFKDHQWKFDVTVRKAELSSPDAASGESRPAPR